MYAGHLDFTQKLLWTVPDLLSAEECASLLEGAASREWLPATINSFEGRVVDARMRDSATAILRDPALAGWLYRRVLPHVPQVMAGMRVYGLYAPLRIYRYEVGQHFGLHHDQWYTAEGGRRSHLTFMVYLNDDFDGGETDFPDLRQTIVPCAGAAVLFQHAVLHAGLRVTRGAKFVLRTDVMYEPASPPQPPLPA